MHSEWKVSFNPAMIPTPYSAYRLKDVNEVGHSGNRETINGFYKTRKEAEEIVAKLNEKENI